MALKAALKGTTDKIKTIRQLPSVLLSVTYTTAYRP